MRLTGSEVVMGIDALARLAGYALSIVEMVERVREESGISDEEWEDAKRKNERTITDLVTEAGGEMPPEPDGEHGP